MDVADFNLMSLKIKKSAKGRGSCGLSAAKKKAEEGGQGGRVSCGHWIARKESTWNGETCGRSRNFTLSKRELQLRVRDRARSRTCSASL